jgi:methyl-accepting chemotaxis protein
VSVEDSPCLALGVGFALGLFTVRYDEFRSAYDGVQQACLEARLDVDGLAAEVTRLAVLRDQVELRSERQQASADLAALTDLLEMVRRTAPPPASPAYEQAFQEAFALTAEANAEDGSVTERINRAKRAINRIRKIAERVDDPRERFTLLKMTEPLTVLADGLEHSRS